MNLENKVANWIDLKLLDYQRACEIQDELVEYRKRGSIRDTILAFQSNPIVTFGNDRLNNKFSDEFLRRVKESKGEDYSQEDILKELRNMDIDFFESNRSGGAAFLAPGQFAYFLILNHQEVTGEKLNVADYKKRIYRAMFDVLKSLGVSEIKTGSQESYQIRRERKDVWVQRDGRSLKMGSKGISFSGNVAYHGFVLHIDKEGLDKGWVVNSCGYEREEVELVSVEEYLGRRLNHDEVHNRVEEAIKNHFRYNQINKVPLNSLYELNQATMS